MEDNVRHESVLCGSIFSISINYFLKIMKKHRIFSNTFSAFVMIVWLSHHSSNVIYWIYWLYGLTFLLFIDFSVCMCMCMLVAHVEVRGELVVFGSLLISCTSQGLSCGCQVCWQMHLHDLLALNFMFLFIHREKFYMIICIIPLLRSWIWFTRIFDDLLYPCSSEILAYNYLFL